MLPKLILCRIRSSRNQACLQILETFRIRYPMYIAQLYVGMFCTSSFNLHRYVSINQTNKNTHPPTLPDKRALLRRNKCQKIHLKSSIFSSSPLWVGHGISAESARIIWSLARDGSTYLDTRRITTQLHKLTVFCDGTRRKARRQWLCILNKKFKRHWRLKAGIYDGNVFYVLCFHITEKEDILQIYTREGRNISPFCLHDFSSIF